VWLAEPQPLRPRESRHRGTGKIECSVLVHEGRHRRFVSESFRVSGRNAQPVFNAALNRRDPLTCRRWIDVDQLEAVLEIRSFVQLSKPDGVGETDSPGFRRRHKSQASDEKHFRPINPLTAHSSDLEAQSIGYRVPEPLGEGQRTNRRAVVELDFRGVPQDSVNRDLSATGSGHHRNGAMPLPMGRQPPIRSPSHQLG
jgi:hypothetical protein